MTGPSHRRGTSSSSIHNFVRSRSPWMRYLRPLLPSFVSDAFFPDHRPTWRLHPTSYLDGLRGVAAILVFFCHYTENNFRALIPPYGLEPDPEEWHGLTWSADSWIQLPFLRVIFSGRPMVHIFFVISGFALSYKPVRCLHAREPDKALAALASSAFRRPFRLFGPCVASTFIIMCLRQMGYLTPVMDTFVEEFIKWKNALFHQITWPWAWDRDLRPAYDIHLWTIPIEFAHSMLLFVVLLMLSRVKLPIRMATVFGLMMYCLSCGKWAGFEFLAGLFLAEVHVLRASKAKEWEGDEESQGPNWALKSFQIFLVVLGLFVAGWPNHEADKTPGISFFHEQTPFPFARMDKLAPQKFWFSLSAVATVWAVGDLDFLREFFEGPFAQYCGRISYAVYICHGPVEGLFKERLIGHPPIPEWGEPGAPEYKPALPAMGIKGLIGDDTTIQITLSWLFGLWLLGPLVIWAADVFWRGIDAQIVTLARKLETVCLDDTEPTPRSQGYSIAA
ncbi:acyltransferase 3 [Chaetomium sp. MPI-SDFR-AT-0129]|nr:acyltransferase 3 [Chaetomium sp. MPI-SDFR-AT-0129]